MTRACPAIASTTAGLPELLSSNVIFSNRKNNYIYLILKFISDWNLINMLKMILKTHISVNFINLVC